jgi:eukaryotic-like serine/threonine-protein kinase
MSRLLDNKKIRHILWAIAVTVIFLFIIAKVLKLYTKYGDTVIVPNLIGFSANELENLSNKNDISTLIIDSIYDVTKKRGTVAYQDPPPDSKVKRNRTVYLTMVAMMPEQVRMPNLIDLTLRQAMATLETYGLLAGNLEYVPDIAKNAVLRQKYKGAEIKTDSWVEKGSKIDLVLGKGVGSDRFFTPLLIGLKRSEALIRMLETSFNLGNEIYEDGKDTLHARVYRQNPGVTRKGIHQPGENMDLWYRSELKFDFESYVQKYKTDSLGLFLKDSFK